MVMLFLFIILPFKYFIVIFVFYSFVKAFTSYKKHDIKFKKIKGEENEGFELDKWNYGNLQKPIKKGEIIEMDCGLLTNIISIEKQDTINNDYEITTQNSTYLVCYYGDISMIEVS